MWRQLRINHAVPFYYFKKIPFLHLERWENPDSPHNKALVLPDLSLAPLSPPLNPNSKHTGPLIPPPSAQTSVLACWMFQGQVSLSLGLGHQSFNY